MAATAIMVNVDVRVRAVFIMLIMDMGEEVVGVGTEAVDVGTEAVVAMAIMIIVDVEMKAVEPVIMSVVTAAEVVVATKVVTKNRRTSMITRVTARIILHDNGSSIPAIHIYFNKRRVEQFVSILETD
ncbi:hypothetical protein MMC15_007711 [Xylographa vitiligo]|nr:hypothetical protein [Xylographa vitiligo]